MSDDTDHEEDAYADEDHMLFEGGEDNPNLLSKALKNKGGLVPQSLIPRKEGFGKNGLSDTPETDQTASYEGNWDTKALRMTAHARNLERERDEARAECERWRSAVLRVLGKVVTPEKFPWEKTRWADSPIHDRIAEEGLDEV